MAKVHVNKDETIDSVLKRFKKANVAIKKETRKREFHLPKKEKRRMKRVESRRATR